MRYDPLPWPFDGWTVDDLGRVYSPNGYTMTPAKIEGMCWLHGFAKSICGDRVMFADTPLVTVKVHELRNLEGRRSNDIKVSRRGRSHRGTSLDPNRITPDLGAEHRWKR